MEKEVRKELLRRGKRSQKRVAEEEEKEVREV